MRETQDFLRVGVVEEFERSDVSTGNVTCYDVETDTDTKVTGEIVGEESGGAWVEIALGSGIVRGVEVFAVE
jgi:hypothetical protein